MAEQRLVDYIKSNLQNGFSIEQIKKALVGVGWSDNDIDEAINAAQGITPKQAELIPQTQEDTIRETKKHSVLPIILVLMIIAAIALGLALLLLGFGKGTPCTENWQCAGWSVCANNSQTRSCTDLSNCGTVKSKPALTQSCTSASQGRSPKEVYLDFKRELDEASNYEELAAVIRKYGSKNQVAKVEAAKDLPVETKNGMFNLIKSLSPPFSQIDNIEEQINSESATLLIETKDKTLEGVITMLKEDGVWKIELESWKQK